MKLRILYFEQKKWEKKWLSAKKIAVEAAAHYFSTNNVLVHYENVVGHEFLDNIHTWSQYLRELWAALSKNGSSSSVSRVQ